GDIWSITTLYHDGENAGAGSLSATYDRRLRAEVASWPRQQHRPACTRRTHSPECRPRRVTMVPPAGERASDADRGNLRQTCADANEESRRAPDRRLRSIHVPRRRVQPLLSAPRPRALGA